MGSSNGALVAFHILCLAVTFSMMVYGTVKYLADESTSIVDAKLFHATEEDIYPTFTICLEIDDKKFDQSMLRFYDADLMNEAKKEDGTYGNTKRKDYVNFLMGKELTSNGSKEIQDITMKYIQNIYNKINYDNVTVDLKKYIERIEISSGDEKLYKWSDQENNENKVLPFYISYRHPTIKCYSIDLSDVVKTAKHEGAPISNVVIQFNKDDHVFNDSSELLMSNFMHYPKQMMRSTALNRDHLGMTAETFALLFDIDNIEVIRRRNARTSTCLEEFDKEDELILKELADKVRCRPSHWKDIDDYSKCSTMQQMSKVLTPSLRTLNPGFLKSFEDSPGQPCSQIYAITYTVKHLFPKPPKATEGGKDPKKNSEDGKGPKKSSDKGASDSHATNKDNGRKTRDTQGVLNTQTKQRDFAKTRSAAELPPIHANSFDVSTYQVPGTGDTTQDNNTEKRLGLEPNEIEKDEHQIVKRSPGAAPPPFKSIDMTFKNPYYKEIKHVQSFNIESYIGNVGGYVGLFLGCAIWEAPDFMFWLWMQLQWILAIFSGGKNKRYR